MAGDHFPGKHPVTEHKSATAEHKDPVGHHKAPEPSTAESPSRTVDHPHTGNAGYGGPTHPTAGTTTSNHQLPAWVGTRDQWHIAPAHHAHGIAETGTPPPQTSNGSMTDHTDINTLPDGTEIAPSPTDPPHIFFDPGKMEKSGEKFGGQKTEAEGTPPSATTHEHFGKDPQTDDNDSAVSPPGADFGAPHTGDTHHGASTGTDSHALPGTDFAAPDSAPLAGSDFGGTPIVHPSTDFVATHDHPGAEPTGLGPGFGFDIGHVDAAPPSGF
jgi:hypothetical protein